MKTALPVDVIVPAYNAAKYLPDALASIAAQTCGVHDVIVVDDGSTDDTAAIARSFGATVISTKNQGVAEARNTAIRASTAATLALLDSDDRWHPERLEVQWQMREAHPQVLLFATDYAAWGGNQTPGGSALAAHDVFPHIAAHRRTPLGKIVAREDLLRAIVSRNFVLPSSMLVDRRLFDEHGLYFAPRESLPENDHIFVGEDLEWLLRVLGFTDVGFVERVLVDYRMRADSLSARRGRIRNGDVILGEIVALHPENYPPGTPALLAAQKQRMLRESAIAHFRAGEMDLAAERLRAYASTLDGKRSLAARLLASVVGFAPMRPLLLRAQKLPKPAWLRTR